MGWERIILACLLSVALVSSANAQLTVEGDEEVDQNFLEKAYFAVANKLVGLFKSLLPWGNAEETSLQSEMLMTLLPKIQGLLIYRQDDARMVTDDEFATGLMYNYTLGSITASLSRIGYRDGFDCHNRAHQVGRLAYNVMESDAFKECGIECHSGCRHGATEAFFADKGTDNLAENLRKLCTDELNGFNSHQCFHGVGHGLTAWTDYDLPFALESCDLLGSPSAQGSCYSGVFMENIVGGINPEAGHETEYLSDDPHFPCNAVEEKYQPACYIMQTSQMIVIFEGDFKLIAEACAKAPYLSRRSCFQSMGRDVSGRNFRDVHKSIAECDQIIDVENANDCLIGAVQDQFWDESMADNAILFCDVLSGMDRDINCYNMMIGRAADVLSTREKFEAFCAKMPDSHLQFCLETQPSRIAVPKSPDATPDFDVAQGDVIIIFDDGIFFPRTVAVRAGSVVTWINDANESFWPASNIHPTHEILPEFDPKQPLPPESEWSFTFTKQGVWRFHDHLNPKATGVVLVN